MTEACAKLHWIISACLGALLPTVLHAETATSFQASATIVSGCEISGVLVVGTQPVGQIGTLNYGTRPTLATGPVTASLAQNPGLSLICSGDVALTMTVNGGLHAATVRNLQAAQGMTRLPYRLYRDAARAQELGIDQVTPINFAASPITLPIFGQVTLPGNSPAGTYTDTVVVTLNW